jgi:ABC-type phosphate/phosphonate transport system substrate-binding protein
MQHRRYEPFTLRFATFLSPILTDAYEFIASYVGEQIGCSSRLVTGTSLEEFAGGGVHLGFACGLLYAQRAHFPSCPVELMAAPVLLPPRYQRKPVYFSDVIVHKASPFASFDDLEGCVWGYNKSGSHSGWNLVRYHLYKQGCGPHFFGSAVETGSHLRSIEMVMQRKVDAAAIDSHVLDIFISRNPDLAAQLRVVALLGPSAIPPLVVSKQLDANLKRDIQQLLLNMHRDHKAARMLHQSLIRRFVSVTEEHYHRIYRMFTFVQKREMASILTAR